MNSNSCLSLFTAFSLFILAFTSLAFAGDVSQAYGRTEEGSEGRALYSSPTQNNLGGSVNKLVPVEDEVGGSDRVLSDLFVMMVEAARSTTYSSLLTLNVTNVALLALGGFAVLGYFGFIPLGAGRRRSLDSEGTFDVSGISSALGAIAPIVRTALETYAQLQQE